MIKFQYKINRKQIEEIADDLKSLDKLSRQEAQDIGNVVVKEMKSLISKGVSPIEGNGKFPPYKHPDRYPGSRKAHRPVNLYLTGKFLDDLQAKPSKVNQYSYSASVGYRTKKEQDKEEGHRIGWNGQPQRPTIPDPDQHEVFHEKIMVAIVDRIKELLRKR